MQALSSRHVASPASLQPRSIVAAPARAMQRQSHVVRVMEIKGEAQWEAEVLKSDKPVLVDFWAVWCGPCKLVTPLMDWAEKEYGSKLKVVKVDTTPNPEIVAKYKVYGLPTLMVFEGGELAPNSHREGAVTKAILEKYIKQHVTSLISA